MRPLKSSLTGERIRSGGQPGGGGIGVDVSRCLALAEVVCRRGGVFTPHADLVVTSIRYPDIAMGIHGDRAQVSHSVGRGWDVAGIISIHSRANSFIKSPGAATRTHAS